jgi:tetratricopeptide (TPR) repeat protein
MTLFNNPFSKRVFPFLLVLLLVFSTACEKQRESQKTAENPPPETESESSYMGSTLFDQVMKKTLETPDSPDAWYHLADLYYRNSLYEKAIDAFAKVVELDPDRGYVYSKMGSAYNRLGRPAEAIAAFQKAVELLPKPSVEYNNIGVAYGKLGKYKEEAEALLKALEIRPRYATARVNLGITYLRLNDLEAAMKQYEELQQIDKTASELLLKEINKTAPGQTGN